MNIEYKLTFAGMFSAIISVVGQGGQSYGAFFAQGYGISSVRTHVANIQVGIDVTCSISATEEAVIIKNIGAGGYISVFMLIGNLPIFTVS